MHERFEVVSGVAGGWILRMWHCVVEWVVLIFRNIVIPSSSFSNSPWRMTASPWGWRHYDHSRYWELLTQQQQEYIPEDVLYTITSVKLGWKDVKFHSVYDTDCVQKFSYSKFSIPLLEPFECDLNCIYLHGHQRLKFTTADCPTALLL